MSNHSAFEKLPRKLTICFDLWTLYATKGNNSPYYDLDKFMLEHVERGFNCIRIDGGAGLIHDLNGNLRDKFYVSDMFGKYDAIPRQFGIIGDGGEVDLLPRLIEIFECAKKYGIYIIMSSWYFLHTYWLHRKGDPICDEIFALPIEERFPAFTRFWHYIILELEKRGLDSQIAFVEIFNEINEHPYFFGDPIRSYGYTPSKEEHLFYKKQHEDAIAWLEEKHPQILFGYDNDCRNDDITTPANAHVYNFHTYHLWNIYPKIFDKHPEWFMNETTPSDVAKTREGRLRTCNEWYDRIAKHYDLKPDAFPEIEKVLESELKEHWDEYSAKLDSNLAWSLKNADGRPVVCGEGVTYVGSKTLLWEEKSQLYWDFVKHGLKKFKEAGMWGTVIKTCCGPEDPCWHSCKDKLLELNNYFLNDEE